MRFYGVIKFKIYANEILTKNIDIVCKILCVTCISRDRSLRYSEVRSSNMYNKILQYKSNCIYIVFAENIHSPDISPCNSKLVREARISSIYNLNNL